MSWIQNVLSRETKASLRKRIADQQETIRMLMGKEVQQLAKMARRLKFGNEIGGLQVRVWKIKEFIEANADALRCLEDVEMSTAKSTFPPPAQATSS